MKKPHCNEELVDELLDQLNEVTSKREAINQQMKATEDELKQGLAELEAIENPEHEDLELIAQIKRSLGTCL